MNTIRFAFQSLLLLVANISFFTICETPSNNSKVSSLRSQLDINALNEEGIPKDPSTRILKHEPEGVRLGVCHNYAISKLLDLEGEIPKTLPIVGAQDWHEVYKFTENYCKEVTTPQPGDLVTYYNDSNCPMVQHTGLVQSDGMIEAKWGSNPYVLLHPTFAVPTHYGKHVKYHRQVTPKDEIINDLHKKIARCGYAKRECIAINQDLIYYAEQNNNLLLWNIGHRAMCADIESTNKIGQTPLMIAAKNNNFELAKMLSHYGADINKQDQNGKTALHLAAENDNLSIIPVLLEYPNCNSKIKDNLDNEAFDYCYEYQSLTPIQYALRRCAKPTKMANAAFHRTINS